MRIAADERLRRSEAQLAEAQRLAALGSWQWDVVSSDITWSPELYRILGRDPDRSPAHFKGYYEALHPSDRPLAEAAIERHARARDAARLRVPGSCGPMASSG